jgi:hypothetical protein
MIECGIPIEMRTDEEKFADGVSRGYSADPRLPKC